MQPKRKFCKECGSILTGRFCGECGCDSEPEKAPIRPETEIIKPNQEIPEGVKIIGLKYYTAGMMRGSYLTIKPDGDEYDVIISFSNIPWPEIDHESFMPFDMAMMGMAGLMAMSGLSVSENLEIQNQCKVTKEATQDFFDTLIKTGILEWDGFSESRQLMAGMHDGQDRFSMRLLLDNGMIIKASGSNAYPNGYRDIIDLIYDFAGKHKN